ncbi:MAG: ABC transporter permease [Acidobacteriota bacterium]
MAGDEMDKLLAIIKREYLMRVKSKGFLLSTFLTPLLMAALVLLPAFLLSKTWRADYRLIVLDQTQDAALYTRVEKHLLTDASNRYQIRREIVAEAQLDARKRELNREIDEDRLSAYIVVPPSVLDDGKIAYHARDVGDLMAEASVEHAFNTAVLEQRIIRSGISEARVGDLSRKIEIERFNERGEGEGRARIALAFALMGVLCLSILIYGTHVMSAVIEEKQSRIIEVLISSVKPFTLMMGKLIGVGLVGLTQYTVWAACAILLSSLAAVTLASRSFKLPGISISLMAFFVLFFLLGYYLYATLYALVGAMVSNDEDGQQVQFPLMIAILVAPLVSMFVWRNPDSAAATVASLIPFFSPFAMFFRIASGQPPFWQIALSIALMIVAIPVVVWLAAKFYRVGALMYGKRPTLAEMAKWLKYG